MESEGRELDAVHRRDQRALLLRSDDTAGPGQSGKAWFTKQIGLGSDKGHSFGKLASHYPMWAAIVDDPPNTESVRRRSAANGEPMMQPRALRPSSEGPRSEGPSSEAPRRHHRHGHEIHHKGQPGRWHVPRAASPSPVRCSSATVRRFNVRGRPSTVRPTHGTAGTPLSTTRTMIASASTMARSPVSWARTEPPGGRPPSEGS
jgi:hypothetical protein